MGPGNRVVTVVALTGIRAGCPDAASWVTLTTLTPSITTHTALSSDQLGRVIVRPSVASTATPPRGPIHNDAFVSGWPLRSATTDATSRPVRDSIAAFCSGIWPNDPGIRGALSFSTAISDP